MRAPPRVEHRLVVRHPRRDAILIEQRASVARLHPWMLDLVPQALRRALELVESAPR